MEITVSIPDEGKRIEWSLPFNNVQPFQQGSAFIYLKNSGTQDIRVDCLSISSNIKVTDVRVHSVIGEPFFKREDFIMAVNRNIGRNGVVPLVEAYTCADIEDLASLGQLSRLDIPKENTTYKDKLNINIAPESSIAITCSTGDGVLSGILTVSQEVIDEE